MWKNNTFTVTARCEMQKKAEMLPPHVPVAIRNGVKLKREIQKNIYSLTSLYEPFFNELEHIS